MYMYMEYDFKKHIFVDIIYIIFEASQQPNPV